MDNFLIFFILLIFYIFILFILKKISYGKKIISINCNNCCPDCEFSLNRIKRKPFDHITQQVTFRIFNAKRYICDNCGWEGLRWEEEFNRKI